MSQVKCPKCGAAVSPATSNCPVCEKDLPRQQLSLVERLKQLPVAGKIALLGAVIFIPGFLFSWGSAPLVWGAALIGIGFFLYIIKVGV